MTTPIEIVRAWQDAVSAGDLDGALALSASDIEVGAPRGSGRGHQLVRDWVARTGIELEQLRLFARANVVIVEQRATWKSPDNTTSTRVIGTVFEVVGRVVARVVRHGSLHGALAAAGLTEADPAR